MTYARSMLPAVETAAKRGWCTGQPWITSAKWKSPKQIRGVRHGRVLLAELRNGMVSGLPAVANFPADVREVLR